MRLADVPLLLLIIGCGGVAAPVLMLLGLARVSAVVGSLLLNLEAPLTMLLAVGIYGEHLGRRAGAGAGLAALGAGILSYAPGGLQAHWRGVVAVVFACLGWAVDNNLTQRLSLRDPVAIARTKGLGAGILTLMLALLTGSALPSPGRAAARLRSAYLERLRIKALATGDGRFQLEHTGQVVGRVELVLLGLRQLVARRPRSAP